MKKSLLMFGAVLASAACVMAQGTVNFSTRVSGIVVGHIYLGAPGETNKTGNTAAELPQGGQTYLGAVLTGSGFSAQLFYAAGTNRLEGSLVPAVASLTVFRTGATLGGTPVPSFQILPGTSVGGEATLQVRAWDNVGGTLLTWDAAVAQGAHAYGKSELFNVLGLADASNPAAPDMTGFRSFNITIVPEPSTFLLGGLGAAALLIFRRRK